MKKKVDQIEDELRAEYDFSQMEGGVRGKYAQKYQSGTNLVLLATDVAEAFPTEESVNEALRLLIRIAKAQVGLSTDYRVSLQVMQKEQAAAEIGG